MKKINQLLCLLAAVMLSVSCSNNSKMENLLENIPENTDLVFVGNVKTVLESAGGKIENSMIVLPTYVSSEMKENNTKEFDEVNKFLKDAGMDIEACAVMYSFRKDCPILVFALDDNDKFVAALKKKEFEKDSEKDGATFYVKPAKEPYGSPNYIAVNGSCAYILLKSYIPSDFNAIAYLQRIIEDAAEANYADTPYGDYILGANGGGLAFKLPAKLKAEMMEEAALGAEANVLLNAVYCMRGELTNNKGTLECKVFPEEGEEFDTEKLAKLIDLKSEINDKALKLLGSQENMVMAMSLKDTNWDELSKILASASRLSRSEQAQMNAVLSYFEKIDGTVAYGIGLTNGIESFFKMDKGQEVFKQFSATLVVEIKEGKAKQVIEDMKGFMEQKRIPFNEDATGFSFNIENTGGVLYVKNINNFIVLANHEIKESNDNPLVKKADFSDCIAACYVGLNRADKLAKDLDVKDNILLGICCKPKDGKAYMSLEIDGNGEGGLIEKVAKMLINSQNKLKQSVEAAYTQQTAVEEAAFEEEELAEPDYEWE